MQTTAPSERPARAYRRGSPCRHAIYFSFVTLATLGDGDVVPRTGVARGVAVLEAVGGQLYVAVTIARLVGAQLQVGPRSDSDAGRSRYTPGWLAKGGEDAHHNWVSDDRVDVGSRRGVAR